MITVQAIADAGSLTEEQVRNAFQQGFADRFTGARLLVLIPDHTRTLPLPFLFRILLETLADTRQLDFMVALGTHPALSEDCLNQLVGISSSERAELTARKWHMKDGRILALPPVRLLNHDWVNPGELEEIGRMEQDEIRRLAGVALHFSLPTRIPICINKAALEHDAILILGPTFPHEVVGYSGGEKYLFPGISGPDLINATHWLGALSGVVQTIGIPDTPVRRMIRAAAERLSTPVMVAALTVEEHELTGVFIGDAHSAWQASVALSAHRHIHFSEKPYQRVLSCAPAMYDELWTAAKAMYKLEPVVAMGGEVIIFAPHLNSVSQVHGKYIYEIGYHILPFFLSDWPRFQHIPLGVLAHSTHMRGSGRMVYGVEIPNVRVTLASQISALDCARLNLGYLDPSSIDPEEWADREDEGILLVRRAGEILYRVKG